VTEIEVVDGEVRRKGETIANGAPPRRADVRQRNDEASAEIGEAVYALASKKVRENGRGAQTAGRKAQLQTIRKDLRDRLTHRSLV